MWIPKKNRKKNKRYPKKTVYDDYLEYNKKPIDKNSLAYKDAQVAKNFKSKNAPTTKRPVKIISKGEDRIAKYLTLRRIFFEREKEFDQMKNHQGFAKLRLDFYIPSLKLAIEYDGIQHFKATKDFDTKTYTLAVRQANDKAKDTYCKNVGIQMLRISYKEYSEIEVIINKILP